MKFKHICIAIQTSKEIIQMDINKMMTNGIFTINDKQAQSENKHNRLQSKANHGSNLLEL